MDEGEEIEVEVVSRVAAGDTGGRRAEGLCGTGGTRPDRKVWPELGSSFFRGGFFYETKEKPE